MEMAREAKFWLLKHKTNSVRFECLHTAIGKMQPFLVLVSKTILLLILNNLVYLYSFTAFI